jgi:3'-5' exoribonuclease
MSRLPRVAELAASSAGWGFFLCARKDVRSGRNGEFLALTLQDVSGQIAAKVFQDVDRLRAEFEAGEFVKIQARGNRYNERLELVIENIRRVNPGQDRTQGFREEDCLPCSPRDVDEMWTELQDLLAREVGDVRVRDLLSRIVTEHEAQLRVWPAAQTVHHAYRSGLLEHILTIARVGLMLGREYDADPDLIVAGAVLHDIGKLRELAYDGVTHYSREGNLVGHIGLGLIMAREAMHAQPDFPLALRAQIEHLIVSHHGSRGFGSPVEPMTIEAFILSMADDLDAKIHQVRRHIAEDDGEDEFTAHHPRLKRVLLKPDGR